MVGDKAGHFRTGTVGEGTDASDLTLPGVQAELVEAVLATNLRILFAWQRVALRSIWRL